MNKYREITLHLCSKDFTGNSAASIRSRLWPIAISKGLYLRIFLHPSATMNHLDVSELQKLLKIPKRNLKSFGERSFSFMAPSVWNSLQPISEMWHHYLSSNLTSKPSCSPRLSRRSSTPNYRLCIFICFICLFVFKCGELYVEREDGREG